jgi:phosphoglycerol transferase
MAQDYAIGRATHPFFTPSAHGISCLALRDPITEQEQSSKWIPVVVLLAVAVAALVLLTLVHLQLPYPFILDDEFRYMQLARFGRVPGSILGKFPVFLYLSTFSWVSRCGEGYLACGRFTNVLFLVASLLPLYRTARIFVDRRLALVIASFAILAPACTYTAYFMAETMYFFVFWCLAWFALAHLGRDPWRLGMGTGALAGLLTLVKPQGLIILAGMAVFFSVLAVAQRPSRTLGWLCRTLLALFLSFVVARFGLGFILAGRDGFDLAGAYRSQVVPGSGISSFWPPWRLVAFYLWGHLAGLVLLFPIPLAVVIHQLRDLARPKPDRPKSASVTELALLTAVLLAVLVAVITKFSADIEPTAQKMLEGRIHERYYDFLFPLLLMATGAFMQRGQAPRRSWLGVPLIVLLSITGVLAGISLRNPRILFADAPALAWIVASPRTVAFLVLLLVLLLAGWLYSARRVAQLYLFGFFPLLAAVSIGFVTRDVQLGFAGGPYERAAETVKRLIPPSRLGQGLVVGGDDISPYRSLVQLDSQTTPILVLPEGTPIEPGRIAADRAWALIVGDHELHVPYAARIALNGARLVAFVPGLLAIDNQPWDGRPLRTTFDAGRSPGPGFHPFDGYCAWSRTTSPVIELPVDVSGDLLGKLFVYGYGPNANRTVQLSLGPGKVDVRLPAQPGEVEFRLRADVPAREIVVTGLLPASPAVVEGSPDTRDLGMCLRWISIQADEKAAPALSRPGG